MSLFEFFRKFKVLGNEFDDDSDGYDALYADVVIGTILTIERPSKPSTFEAVTIVDNVYYEASTDM